MSSSRAEILADMKENEIRPEALRRGQEEAYERDLVRLRQRISEFVVVPCPACGSHDYRFAFEKYCLQFQKCCICETIYMSPRPTPKIMGDYYSNSENYRYWAENIFPASEAARREKIHRPMLDYIVAVCDRLDVPRELLVEVGPGFGTFAALAKGPAGFAHVLAIERTPEMAAACRARGVHVIEEPVEVVRLDQVGRANVVVSFEVIEHLFEPRDYLQRCAALLACGGLLVLTCPNGLGFDVEVLGAKAAAVDSEHVNLFNPDSLSRLLAQCGFDVIEAATPGHLDAEFVHTAAMKGEVDLTRDPFLHRVLVRDWERLGAGFQQFLAAHGLSSHMRVVARCK